MTALLIVLIAIIWIAYGVFTIYQIVGHLNIGEYEDGELRGLVFCILLAPLFIVGRAICGIFANIFE